jgi:UDP-N-acetylmuramyl tripeptide synthase
MGAIAASFSDLCVITSDNPRTEDPNKIIEDILAGTRQGNAETVVELDRRKAIEVAWRRRAGATSCWLPAKDTKRIKSSKTAPFISTTAKSCASFWRIPARPRRKGT